MAIVLFDNHHRSKLYPFTQTHAVGDLRMGIFSFAERWQQLSGEEVFILAESYLQCLYPAPAEEMHLFIDASIIPTNGLLEKILSLDSGIALADENGFIAGRIKYDNEPRFTHTLLPRFATIYDAGNVKRLSYPWELTQWNDAMIRSDYSLITKNRASQNISSTNTIISPENIFIEEGAVVEYATLNASTGPIYIGKDAVVMEGAFIRGPFALGQNSMVRMGAKIYGATTLGPGCLGGGEIKNSVMQAHSNKAHDGYLGDSVIGHWCNIGAGASNSNIKNTGAEIMMRDFATGNLESAGNKCGMFIGSYTRVAINSSINTGTVIGVCCNVFGEGLLPRIIPSFTWGIEQLYAFDSAMRDINNWKKLKQQSITEGEIAVLKHIFEGQTNNS